MPVPPPHFDVIIAGSGAAGLSLAYALSRSSKLATLKVLLIDKEEKTENDRTWCYWEEGEGPYEDILHQQWDQVHFYGLDFHKVVNMTPYRYKMIRGEDFYRKIWQHLDTLPHFEKARGSIAQFDPTASGITVTTDAGAAYTADWVFNSTPYGVPQAQPNKYSYLLQHFKGYEITTHEPVFDPKVPTFMDFRVDQGDANDARFGYVLPDNPNQALVEYTVFSPHVWEQARYDQALQDYLTTYWKLPPSAYTINRVEFGVIPMTDQYFPARVQRRIIQLGTSGGQTRASTGYTFQRIQQHTQALVQHWEQTGSPLLPRPRWKQRFNFYDAVLLQVIEKNWVNSRTIFTRIFQRNPEQRVFRFLDGATTFGEEIALMNSMPHRPFLRGVLHKLYKRIFR